MDTPPNSRCRDCQLREGRLCLAVPRPDCSERLRTGLPVTDCVAYAGPNGEFRAIEGTQKASRLGIRF